jgi:hypothetical protein
MKKNIGTIMFFCILSLTLLAQKNETQLTIIGPKFPLPICGVSINTSRQQVMYFSSEMYIPGIVEKVEFALKKPTFSEKGDTIGYKMPLMLKLYARDTINNIPGKELLKDTILVKRGEKNKMVIDLSKYNILLPSYGFYVGFEAFSTEWYIANGYMTKDNLSYKTKGNVGGGFIFHAPVVVASNRKKDIEKYQNYVLGGWAKEWKNCNEMYHSTLVIRLHIRK